MNITELKAMARTVRSDIVTLIPQAGSGHPGGSLSATDLMVGLYFGGIINVDPADPEWAGRDRFILSKGHVAPVLYSVLARRGYFPVEELATFRRFGTRLQGHPCVEKGLPGVNQAAGSLGQGLSVALGAAIAKRMKGDPNAVYVLLGDGECEEGQVWEAAMAASHYKVDNLLAMTDWNHQQIDGTTEEVAGLGDLRPKWEAFGWTVIEADGHDFGSIEDAFTRARSLRGRSKPVMILWHTEMGHGVDFMAGTCKWHGKNPSAEQCAQAMQQLEETMGDFAL